MKTERFERGSYLVFDTNTWDAVRKDNFVVRLPRMINSWWSQNDVVAEHLASASSAAPSSCCTTMSTCSPDGNRIAP